LIQNRYSITSSWDGNYNSFARPGDPDYKLGFVNIIRVDADVNTLSVYSLLEEEPELQFESPIGEFIASNSNVKSVNEIVFNNEVESKIKYIKMDETVVGELNYDSLIGYRDRYVQEYTFVCGPNDPKNLKINVSSDTFDTFVYIKDKNDTIIFENDDIDNRRIRLSVVLKDGNVQERLNNALPSTIQSALTSQAIVEEGNSLLMAGFTRTQMEEAETGVPILKDIPVLGWFFKQKTMKQEQYQRSYLITPKILWYDREKKIPNYEVVGSPEKPPVAENR
jgi:hypothetical protein